MSEQLLLLATFVIPVTGAVLVFFAGERHANLREAVTILTSLLLFIAVCSLYYGFDHTGRSVLELAEPVVGLYLEFRISIWQKRPCQSVRSQSHCHRF